ncbi:MAG: hypothetical protein HXY20_09400, partial [Acidobacteria bacterium]|nr:hypothetical protein [Acidobacteriota bacterium]
MLEITPTIASVLSGAAVLFGMLLAVVVFLKDMRSPSHQSFAAGMTLLALQQVLIGLSRSAILPEDVLSIQRWRMAVSSLIPGIWLLFSVVFARANYRDFLLKWKWALAAAFALPVLLGTAFSSSIFAESPIALGMSSWLLPLGPTGKALFVCFIICAALILANLERTLRAATGRIRWQVKFTVLALGTLCAGWIYSGSQALLYRALDTDLDILLPITLLAACALFFWAMIRSEFLNVDVYLSHTTIQYSLTVLLAGAYFVVVGLMAQFLDYVYPDRSLPLNALLVLLALTGLGILLLSDRLQERLRRLVTRHFRRPRYDYRKAWMELTEKTRSLSDLHDLCTEFAKTISHTLGILSVNIWLYSESDQRLTLAGSTVFTRSQAGDLERSGAMVSQLAAALKKDPGLVDFGRNKLAWPEDIVRAKPEFYSEYGLRYAIPFGAEDRLAGVITLNEDKVGGSDLSTEDLELLHTYAAQLAASVLRLQLTESLRQAQEFETFQHVSAFFIHDLKNLASRLSLTMQNLQVHFDNPQFRADALRLISQSLAAIDEKVGRISSLRQKLELRLEETDLAELVRAVVGELTESGRVELQVDIEPLPRVLLDPEQIRKVLTNLVLNAQEAVDDNGHIRVVARAADGM